VWAVYHYTDALGPKFLWLVPYLIPVTWFMMSCLSFVIAERLVLEKDAHHEGSRGKRGWRRILAVAAGLKLTVK
jgi:uncharacterized membrane protein